MDPADGNNVPSEDIPHRKHEHTMSSSNPNSHPRVPIPTKSDNFYSPQNYAFYSQQPYEPLDRSSRSIRLLKFCDDYQFGPIRCEFTDWMPLEEARGTYTAVSYCAGDPSDIEAIQVNGLQFNAFTTLARSLSATFDYRVGHHQDGKPLLWVDQICINQSDAAERSHQVSFMGDIYRCARDVAICLSTTIAGQDAIGYLKSLYWNPGIPDLPFLVGVLEAKVAHPLLLKDNPHIEGYNQEATDFAIHDLRAERMGSTWTEQWRDLRSLILQPWWKRAWTFQEFVLADDAFFLCGSEAIPWSIMTVVLLCMFNTDDKNVINYDTGDYSVIKDEDNAYLERAIAAMLFVLNYKAGFGKPGDLLKLLSSHARFCGASDKRDRVYAFLGLVDPMYGISPDYSSQSIQDVCVDTARHILLYDRNLSILPHAAMARGELSSSLPSWVPDWTSENNATWRSTKDGIDSQETFDHLGKPLSKVRFLNDNKVLEVSGIFVEKLHIMFRDNPRPPLNGKLFSVFATDTALVARTNNDAQRNDEVWLLSGADFPVVLRVIKSVEDMSLQCNPGHIDDRKHTDVNGGEDSDIMFSKTVETDVHTQQAESQLRYKFICETEIVTSIHLLSEVGTQDYMVSVAKGKEEGLQRIQLH